MPAEQTVSSNFKITAEATQAIDKVRELIGPVSALKRALGGLDQVTRSADIDKLTKDLKRLEKQVIDNTARIKTLQTQKKNLKTRNTELVSSNKKLRESFRGAGRAAGIYSAALHTVFSIVQRGVGDFFKFGFELEASSKRFLALNRNGADAIRRLEEIKSIGEEFGIFNVNLIDGANKLRAYGFEGDQVVDMSRRLAIATAGNSELFSRLALAMGQVEVQGTTAYMEELRQIAEAGVPIFSQLARNLQLTGQELRKAFKDGLVETAEVKKAFKELTDEGSLLFKGAEASSKTILAEWTRLKNTAADVANAAFGTGGFLNAPLRGFLNLFRESDKQILGLIERINEKSQTRKEERAQRRLNEALKNRVDIQERLNRATPEFAKVLKGQLEGAEAEVRKQVEILKDLRGVDNQTVFFVGSGFVDIHQIDHDLKKALTLAEQFAEDTEELFKNLGRKAKIGFFTDEEAKLRAELSGITSLVEKGLTEGVEDEDLVDLIARMREIEERLDAIREARKKEDDAAREAERAREEAARKEKKLQEDILDAVKDSKNAYTDYINEIKNLDDAIAFGFSDPKERAEELRDIQFNALQATRGDLEELRTFAAALEKIPESVTNRIKELEAQVASLTRELNTFDSFAAQFQATSRSDFSISAGGSGARALGPHFDPSDPDGSKAKLQEIADKAVEAAERVNEVFSGVGSLFSSIADLSSAIIQHQTDFIQTQQKILDNNLKFQKATIKESFQLRKNEIYQEITDEKIRDRALARLAKRQREAEERAEEEHKKERIKLENKYQNAKYQAEYQAAVLGKAARVADITGSGAVAIARILAEHAANPVLSGILTALTGASIATQLGVVAATPLPVRPPPIPLLAEGGYVDKPTLAMIGEAGPELVIPEKKLQNMGTTIINNYLVDADDFVRVIEERVVANSEKGHSRIAVIPA